MKWNNASDENPGFSVIYYDDPDLPGHRYVIQKKKTPGGIWRLAFRDKETDPLRVIFVGQTQKECKQYAQDFREQAQQ
jgi:hypothetical protein